MSEGFMGMGEGLNLVCIGLSFIIGIPITLGAI